jgi:hypothetical protein
MKKTARRAMPPSRSRPFNYFMVCIEEGGKVIARRIVRAPLGYSWLDQVRQQYWTTSGRWDVREELAINYGTDRLAWAALRRLAIAERSTMCWARR